MIVRFHFEGLRLLVIVGHAPNNPYFTEATSFWKQISDDIPSTLRSWPVVALLDANARVGSVISASVDDFGADTENLAGECFHQWLHNHALFLPQTFEVHHDGDHATWQHSSGATARLDYIAVDRVLYHPAIRTQIANVDLSLHHPDHCSVQLDLHLSRKLQIPHHRSEPTEDASGDAPPIPQISWKCDVHSHAAALQDWMTRAGPSKPRAVRRKKHLHDDTWALIRTKRYHWNRMRTLKRLGRQSILREIFSVWSRRVSAIALAILGWPCWIELLRFMLLPISDSVAKLRLRSNMMTSNSMLTLLKNKVMLQQMKASQGFGVESSIYFPRALPRSSPTFDVVDLQLMN